MSRVATAVLSLSALMHNLSIAKKAAPKSKILAVIKANAYGHGLLRIASALNDADGFAVAHLEEVQTLRQAKITKMVVLLQGFIDEAELAVLLSLKADVVVHSFYQISILEKIVVPPDFTVWLKIDTGMGRLGIPAKDLPQAWARLNKIPQLSDRIRLMSHFANADDLLSDSTREQLAQFNVLTSVLSAEKSIANSAGLLGWKQSHFDWVRPGIMLYGVSAFLDKSAEDLDLKPVMTLKSQIIAINQIIKHQSIGYGSCWQALEDTHVAVVGCGYGDGYPRHIADDTTVLVKGKPYPIVGRISMDMLCINVGQDHALVVGDEVILWGEGLPVEYVAAQAGTLAYELLCQVTARVKFEIMEIEMKVDCHGKN